MREILFKAKGQTTGEWFEGLLTRFDQDVCRIKDKYREEWICDASTICQCTGLTDKNGKKIWENDIVRTNRGRLCSVVWFASPRYQGFDLKPIECKNPPPTQWDLWKDLEVIGNIFDNPELLGTDTD